MDLAESAAEKSQSSRVPKTAFLLMLVMVIGLLMLAVFANLQRFRRTDVETVATKPATSPVPSAHGH